LYRIRAKKNIIVNGSIVVHKDDLGGFIEKEENLDYKSSAWISGNAKVYDNAKVSGGAQVSENTRIYENALVYGNAWKGSDHEPSNRLGTKPKGNPRIYL